MVKVMTPAEAKAVYEAMAALNNVDGRLHARFERSDNEVLHVRENEDGTVQVFIGDAIGNPTRGQVEQFCDQNAFATAYEVC